uniref:Uncharacterized protein n=1 Tax=Knipowitschia caucasica TaxID=637954 RepID=A0AAV2LUT4_KNICA
MWKAFSFVTPLPLPPHVHIIGGSSAVNFSDCVEPGPMERGSWQEEIIEEDSRRRERTEPKETSCQGTEEEILNGLLTRLCEKQVT